VKSLVLTREWTHYILEQSCKHPDPDKYKNPDSNTGPPGFGFFLQKPVSAKLEV